MGGGRDTYFDLLRGLAIIMVIFIHTTPLPSTAFQFACRQMIHFAVPLFLTISGFFLANKDVSTRGKYRLFLWHQIPKIYVPCQIVLILYVIIDHSWSIGTIAHYIICDHWCYYYIGMSCILYTLLPLFQRTNKTGLIFMLTATIVMAWIIVYAMPQMKVKSYINMSFIPFTHGGFFALGIYYRKYGCKTSLLFSCILYILSIVGGYIEGSYLISIGQSGHGYKLFYPIISLSAIMILFNPVVKTWVKESQTIIKNALIGIGNLSFGIYLYHTFFLRFIPKTDIWVLDGFIILVSSSCFCYIVKLILRDKSRYFGVF